MHIFIHFANQGHHPQGKKVRPACLGIKTLNMLSAGGIGRSVWMAAIVLLMLGCGKNEAPKKSPLKDNMPGIASQKDRTADTSIQQTAQKPVAKTDPFEGQMVFIKGGSFTMGQPNPNIGCDGCSDLECPHKVSVGSFSMAKFEVTQIQWQEMMGENPSTFKGCDQCPVDNVSLKDAQTFINKLNTRSGKTYRLPTEAEWEYAAKSGAKNNSYIYAGSNTANDVAWHYDNSGSETHPVGEKKPNSLGLYDMSGNISEWCTDTYESYACEKQEKNAELYLVRGGSWLVSDYGCRVTYRGACRAGQRGRTLGFRIVLSSN